MDDITRQIEWIKERNLGGNHQLIKMMAYIDKLEANLDTTMASAVKFAEAMKDRRWDQSTWDSITAFLASAAVGDYKERQKGKS